MNGLQVYRDYLALKKHFTSNYNYHLYNGNVRVKQETFERRNDRYFFCKLANKFDPFNFLLANIVEKPDIYITDINSEHGDKIYFNWKKRNQALTHNFANEIEFLDDDFNKNFIIDNNQIPVIIQLYRDKKISIETLSILSFIFDVIPYWERKISDPLLNDEIMKIKKYVGFIKFDEQKIRTLLKQRYK